MRPATLLRLAVAGTRTDTLRIVLTGLGSALGTLALLSAATVLSIQTVVDPLQPDQTTNAPYTNGLLAESGLRPGLATALILLIVPVLLFVGQCARLGAPARDRRLAAIRLAGATPRQGLALASAESGLATLLGTVLGLAVYLAGRWLLDAPDARGLRPLPTDVLPPWWALVAIVLGLPVIATLATGFLLRRVTVTPLGVVRRVRTRSPRPWPGLLIVFGVALYVLLFPLAERMTRHRITGTFTLALVALFLGALAAAIGVVTGAGWISYTAGRLLSRYARRPAGLIAGRRLQADPWSGSRALAALLTAVLFAGGAAWLTSYYRTWQQVQADSQHAYDVAMGQPSVPDDSNGFYLRAMQLVWYGVLVAAVIAAAGLAVAMADSIVARRRVLASLTASGVPRAVLGRAVLWQTLVTAIPALVLAAATGLALAAGYTRPSVAAGGTTQITCTPPAGKENVCHDPLSPAAAPYVEKFTVPGITERIPIPWSELGVVAGWGLAATVLTTGLGLAFLRSSTAPEELRTT